MNWETLTCGEFEEAARTTGGVCLLPVGVLEKHGDHLPLGQDGLYVHALCERAAAQEPAVVFPHYYFGQINEARHLPGTIALGSRLLLDLLEAPAEIVARMKSKGDFHAGELETACAAHLFPEPGACRA